MQQKRLNIPTPDFGDGLIKAQEIDAQIAQKQKELVVARQAVYSLDTMRLATERDANAKTVAECDAAITPLVEERRTLDSKKIELEGKIPAGFDKLSDAQLQKQLDAWDMFEANTENLKKQVQTAEATKAADAGAAATAKAAYETVRTNLETAAGKPVADVRADTGLATLDADLRTLRDQDRDTAIRQNQADPAIQQLKQDTEQQMRATQDAAERNRLRDNYRAQARAKAREILANLLTQARADATSRLNLYSADGRLAGYECTTAVGNLRRDITAGIGRVNAILVSGDPGTALAQSHAAELDALLRGFDPGPRNSADPRVLAIMDEWLARAVPPQQRGDALRYDSWGRLTGRTRYGVMSPGPAPQTALSRGEYLRRQAGNLRSTNLGTMEQYVESRLNAVGR